MTGSCFKCKDKKSSRIVLAKSENEASSNVFSGINKNWGSHIYSSSVKEPSWITIEKMPILQFFQWIRERNWTSRFYNGKASPLCIQFFRDAGRFSQLNQWDGYRAIVLTADGKKKWVDMSVKGADTFMTNYNSGGTVGSTHELRCTKRRCRTDPFIDGFGYNQVFEEIFGAYEQRLAAHEKNMFFDASSWIDARLIKYDAPGDKKIHVSWHWTLPEFKFSPYIKATPKILFWCFAYSFIGVVIGMSIFSRKEKPPMDVQGALEFAYSKADARKDGKTGICFRDIAGMENVVKQLKEVVMLLRYPGHYDQNTIKTQPPKGILLEGEAGTGKTRIAKAIANEAGLAFYQMSGSEFIQAIVGVGAARIRDLFRRARVNSPSIVFIDEIDAFGVIRAESGSEATDEREQTLNQLLTEMDGFSSSEGVVLIAATNRSDLLDPALKRAGRLDRKIVINKPDLQGREEILKVHAQKYNMGTDVDLADIAKKTPGLSPAELSNIINEGGLEAIRRISNKRTRRWKTDSITHADICGALDRLYHGVKKIQRQQSSSLENFIKCNKVRKAFIETTLKAAAYKSENVSSRKVISIGRGGNFTGFVRESDDEYLVASRAKQFDRIRATFISRASEEILLQNSSNITVPDLAIGYRQALQRVCMCGLVDDGLFHYQPSSREIRDGKDKLSNVHTYTANFNSIDPIATKLTLTKINAAVRVLLSELYADSRFVLLMNSKSLASLARLHNQ
eukprot:gnl/MRDRNA2_/MRDRNA2_84769_c0_seq1.p1 gnl/MRDRNA2_/MRDRNA2_84769_c0~~gnl/MRDRNA2_/MRDRNA2_84769_c0_seq1.p1  ORF type:complete len:755 (+),score=34.34 gnl/MRDRNA2_/MRDRNA2_84769_c0_seq1:57-2267(+)